MILKQAFHPEGYGAPAAPYSPVIESDGLLFVSGQVPLNEQCQLVGDSFDLQLEQVHKNLLACLTAAGCTIDDVLKASVFLTRESDFDAFNAAYNGWFDGALPARTTIRADLLRGFLVEIDVIARRSPSATA